MDGVEWVARRFEVRGPLSGPEAGVVLAADRLAPAAPRLVALKEAREPSARQALSTEVSGLLRLVHPSLRGVVAHGSGPEAQVVALEHVDGEDLAAALGRRPEEARAAAEGLLRALVYLHASGLAHGDLKPGNVLVSGGAIRLIDLGLVTRLGAARRGGTHGFIAPETLRGAPSSVAADLYGFGATLEAALPERPGGRLGRLIATCLEADPAARPASADSALGMLGSVPRPIDRWGEMRRAGGGEPLAALTSLLERLDGRTVVIEGPRGAGRSRLVRDALRPALGRGQPIADGTLAGGGSPLLPLARLLLSAGAVPADSDRAVAMAAAAAGRGGIAVVLDDADLADDEAREHLALAAATLAEVRCGALALVGADRALADRLAAAGATRLALPRLEVDEALAMLEAVGALADRALAAAIVEAAEGRIGVAARTALALSDRPGAGAPEARRLVAGLLDDRPAAKDAEPALPGPEAVARAASELEAGACSAAAAHLGAAFPTLAERPRQSAEAAAILARAEAGRGRLAAGAGLVEALGDEAPPALRLEAARWLERLGHLARAEALAAPLLGSLDQEIRASAAAEVAQAAQGQGEPDRADRLAAEALETEGIAPALACRLLCVRSDVALVRGQPEAAVAHAAEAARLARRAPDRTLLPKAIAREATGHGLGGRPLEARDRYREALEAAVAAGDVAGLPPYVLNLATAEQLLGELGSAIERYQHAARLAGGLGRQVARAAALVNWAGLLVDIGAAEEAGPVLDDARAAAEAAGSALYAAQAELVRAALLGRGAPAAGRAAARDARAAFLACGAARQALEAELLEAELALADGDRAPARALLSTRREELRRGGLEGRSALLEARAHLDQAELDAGLRAAERAASLARDEGDADLEARALGVLALAHGRLGTGAEQPILLRAREALGRVAAKLPAGLRERYLGDPTRLAVVRSAEAGAGRRGVASDLGPAPARVLALVRRLLLEAAQEDRLLEAAVDEAVQLVGAERAFLLRQRRPGGQAHVAVARNIARETIRRGGAGARFSRSVAERVLETGEQTVTASASDDPELRGSRSILDLGLRSILCVPIRGPEGVVGALYLDHRFETGRFGPEACELVQSLADVIGVALEQARLRREAEDKARELEAANAALARDNVLRSAEVERLGRLLEQGGGERGDAPGGIIGRAPALRRALEVIRRVAPSPLPVLVEGESGTGKELLARYVHSCSLRRAGPFLAINCGAVPETLLESELFGHVRGAFTGATRDHPGLFRAAEGGTVLLDEIGEMAPSMQPRLLRVLQEGEVWPLGLDRPVPVDVRVVAATNRDLEKEVDAGRFRQDLFFRLVGVRVAVPPLRERLEDIPLLADAFLERIAAEPGGRRMGLTRSGLRALLAHGWPGNVRELEQSLRRAVLLCEREELDAEDLDLGSARASRREAIRSFDRELVERTLRACGGNRSVAARTLGVSRSTLHRWLARYGIR